MQGIGDQIYARPFIKLISQQHDVYVSTVLPELYADLNVKFVNPGEIKYRTQHKNFDDFTVPFVNLPKHIELEIDWHYGREELKRHAIIAHLEKSFGLDLGPDEMKFDLPNSRVEGVIDDLVKDKRRIAIVRPVTKRKEWACYSKAPNPNYIAWCARILKDARYHVISIADCVEDEEWIDGNAPPADIQLHKGELGIIGTLSLMKRAHIVVGGSGFIIPGAISAGTNLFVIFGGRGEYDNPHKLFDIRMNMKKIGWVIPDNFCRCNKINHSCDKTISNLDDHFMKFMKEIA